MYTLLVKSYLYMDNMNMSFTLDVQCYIDQWTTVYMKQNTTNGNPTRHLHVFTKSTILTWHGYWYLWNSDTRRIVWANKRMNVATLNVAQTLNVAPDVICRKADAKCRNQRQMSQYFELPLYVATSTLNVALFYKSKWIINLIF